VRLFLFAVATFCIFNYSFAKSILDDKSGCLDCFNFVAPSILGAENVNPAEIGLIVYDSYFNKFRGYTTSGVWSKLSSESVVRVATATGSAYLTDDLIIANAASGAITLTLPSASTITGKEFVFKKSDSSSNQVTIVGAGSETIDGSANRKLNIRYESVRLVSDGANWLDVSQKSNRTPTIQKFTSGNGTYATPTGVTYIRVRMVGGGGGGSGSGTGSSMGGGGTGGASTFGTSLLVANGGGGGNSQSVGGTGGTASLGTGPIGTNSQGGQGGACSLSNGSTSYYIAGGYGAASPFSGQGSGGEPNAVGKNAVANSGSGGGGGGGTPIAALYTGSGGGSGGFIDAIIQNPSTSYAYTIGVGGSAGSAGTSGTAGGAGGSGYIEVTEYYQ